MNVLRQVITILKSDGIDVIVLKGAALCNTLYPDPGLRPMRDMDILIEKKDVERAQLLMVTNGFTASTEPIPPDHFHLPGLYQTVDNVAVCIELHQALFPSCPPYYKIMEFKDLQRSSVCFDLNGARLYSLGHVDMLWHLYKHGFCMPLTYEQYRLITVADMVGMVENKFDEIDWSLIESDYPELLNVLPLLHYLTPWQDHVKTKLSLKIERPPSDVGMRFRGWPQVRLSGQRSQKLLKFLYDTVFPPQWWFRIYYKTTGWWSWYYSRLIKHPLHILWWVRLYGLLFCRFHLAEARAKEKPPKSGSIRSWLWNVWVLARVLYRKIY